MSGRTNDNFDQLDDAAWSRCEARIKAFEQAWRQGSAPSIADFLCGNTLERKALLIELVHTDLELRVKAGHSVEIEHYLRSYPELSSERRVIEDLIAAQSDFAGQRSSNSTVMQSYLTGEMQKLLQNPDLVAAENRAAEPHNLLDEAPTFPQVEGYKILERIGRGGMGVVYRALELSLSRHVALKFLPDDYARDADRLERFAREARAASALNHPHICTVHALGEHEGRSFIVMEYIQGVTLQSVVARRPAFDEVARLVVQAARALAAAHSAGVVHRDIKPENIMVRDDGYVKVVDFGLARRPIAIVEPATAGSYETDAGAMLGTVAYMSPEQVRGDSAETASDIFALGIVVYQLLTGVHPFDTGAPLSTLAAIAGQQPLALSHWNAGVPDEIEQLVSAMLHKEPQLRPTASEVEAIFSEVRETGCSRRTVPARPIVRREAEIGLLNEALDDASAGRGRVICIAGEPGIGKTTLVDDFLSEVSARSRTVLIARGQCSERLTETEAYLPVIGALESLLRSDSTGSVARIMQAIAPSWYAQISPQAHGANDHHAAPLRAKSQQSLLREFCKLLEECGRRGPVILFFDDVHWADLSTVDLIAHLGHQCHGLRTLVVVTYRPTELLLNPHPFYLVKLELQGKGVCRVLPLNLLSRADVDRYFALAFADHAFATDFGDEIYARTEGSPLFIVDLLGYLTELGVVARRDGRWSVVREMPSLREQMPESVRSMIERKLDRLEECDRQLLSAAAVQGYEFDSATVAEAVGLSVVEAEERLDDLDRVHGLIRLLREQEFPDRTLTLRYGFVHALYQQSFYNGLSPRSRARLGSTVGRLLESRFRGDTGAIAAELACLYEVGRDYFDAAKQFLIAAQNAAQVFAHHEAIVLARRGLGLLESLPDIPEHCILELQLQTTLGLQLQVTEGYAAPSAREAYSRARTLCRRYPDDARQFPVLWGLWLCHKVGSELFKAQSFADELFALALRMHDPALALQAHQALGMTAFCRGQPAVCLHNVEQVATIYNPAEHRDHSSWFGQDPGVICKSFGAVVLWLLGYPDAAKQQSEAAIRMSEDFSPTSQAVALHFAAMVHQLRREAPWVRHYAERSRAIGSEHGLSFWRAGGTVLSGWAIAISDSPSEGLARMRAGLRDWRATGSVTYETYYLGLLAEVLTLQGQQAEARTMLEEAFPLVDRTDERFYEAELYRLRGELRLRLADSPDALAVADAEHDFRHALEIARQQEARLLELRAAASLARLDAKNDAPTSASQVLADVYGAFAEGFETADLEDARALLHK